MSELNLILLGPPGAGKGTQAERLKDDFGLPYIGTGDLLRKHKDEGTELGREAQAYMDNGDLVPDELVDPHDPRGDRGEGRRRASCSTATRARSGRPTRSARRSRRTAAG